MNILDKIVNRKKEEVAAAKENVPVAELKKSKYFNRIPYVLKDFLLDPARTGIIAEFKRRSPSKGVINASASVKTVTQGYAAAGVAAISVLTDIDFFGGHPDDLLEARAVNEVPLLRKDFIIDTYQILEAKAWGADIILLIAAILTRDEIISFAKLAKEFGLNVLLEVHNLEELEKSLCPFIDAVGVNNRNLADFTVDIRTSFDLFHHIPDAFLKISESAISDPKTIIELKATGFNGFLIGENFMKTEDPVAAIQTFSSALISV
ncbi:indole-3-glycerol phosphate synthase [Pedobacter antarcticus 4BY]|uniref:indole-3-glycerol-phosphate synthase n=2 Tax=Pedobacter antarcticus TaxID=34086 RepID=A0A081PM11_9SPHI|nr:indole-3-glycerol phosphate synthase TrpC [Pedobacter antarcticus]KEQ31734.1 indole-3-glycerol phosphate synthase [Pedobacter antarcticus 4BY]SFF47374.1 indole-3-glycerol phosphate synthase [Pedobacter antarcticus]